MPSINNRFSEVPSDGTDFSPGSWTMFPIRSTQSILGKLIGTFTVTIFWFLFVFVALLKNFKGRFGSFWYTMIVVALL